MPVIGQRLAYLPQAMADADDTRASHRIKVAIALFIEEVDAGSARDAQRCRREIPQEYRQFLNSLALGRWLWRNIRHDQIMPIAIFPCQ